MTSTDNPQQTIRIEVAYALPDEQRLVMLDVPAGTTARAAIDLAGLAEEFPQLDTAICPLGVFGRERPGSYVVQPGDRVEIYRPLLHEPRETRRKLAARGKTMGVVKDPRYKSHG